MQSMNLFEDSLTKVLTIQEPLNLKDCVYPNGKTNYKHALPVYKRLFSDYNRKFNTTYDFMFWGFSELLVDNLRDAVWRATEMIQIEISSSSTKKVYLLNVPSNICLETDFYNFSDEIFAYEFPTELASNWENIYSNRKAEKQVIFPYIDQSMLISEYNLSSF